MGGYKVLDADIFAGPGLLLSYLTDPTVDMFAYLCFCFALCASATHLAKRAPEGVPDFVVKYAPIVYLHSEDPYRPSDIAAQLVNTEPKVDFKAVSDRQFTLDNLADLNNLGGEKVYLTSKVKPDLNPEYLLGKLPDDAGATNGAVSSAIIVNDHGDGTVDAFYFYFYANDRGALNIGDHVGDWEHSMIRFVNETPSALWYSQHSNGQAFKYSTVQKYEDGVNNVRVSKYLECHHGRPPPTDLRIAHSLQCQRLSRQLRHKRNARVWPS